MNWLQQAVGKEWNIHPAGGLTGDAYVAKKNEQRLFLKRNSSPFLAVLSAVGIVPKLVWTKRMENGDVITAQEWLEGRELHPEEMQHYRVAALLAKIHQSSELLHMLMRLGKKPATADDRFTEMIGYLKTNGLIDLHKEIRESIEYLHRLLPVTRNQQKVVCHCDLNHHNMIWTKQDQLYLVDWDNAMIADPAMDYGFILKWYIPRENWNDWLYRYGITHDNQLIERIHWYLIMDSLYYLNWHYERNEIRKAHERLSDLRDLNHHVRTIILD
ncbi:phosphotransferase family protein [Lentibacillus halophilus]|uniref:Phosphotransferase family protein n=1 Tax=Lentibacillus halophilus TaxID=295065 RepID=A0ABP3IW42_9BACI